jgi:hypothetical protein
MSELDSPNPPPFITLRFIYQSDKKISFSFYAFFFFVYLYSLHLIITADFRKKISNQVQTFTQLVHHKVSLFNQLLVVVHAIIQFRFEKIGSL